MFVNTATYLLQWHDQTKPLTLPLLHPLRSTELWPCLTFSPVFPRSRTANAASLALCNYLAICASQPVTHHNILYYMFPHFPQHSHHKGNSTQLTLSSAFPLPRYPSKFHKVAQPLLHTNPKPHRLPPSSSPYLFKYPPPALARSPVSPPPSSTTTTNRELDGREVFAFTHS